MEMEEMDLLELWHILMKRKGQIVAIFLLAVIAAGLLSMYMEPVYQARATLMLKGGTSSSLANLDPLGSLTGSSSTNVLLQNYIYMLKSRTMLVDVLEKMGYDEEAVNQNLKTVSDGLSVQQLAGTEILEIRLESEEPEFATDFVNILSQTFIDTTRDENRSDLRTAQDYLAEQIKIAADQLSEAEEMLKEFRARERMVQPMQDSALLVQQSVQWDSLLAETRIAKIEVEQRLRQIEDKLTAQDEIIISATTIQNNPLVQSYQQRLSDLEISLSGALELYTDLHPEVLSLKAEIQETRSKLSNEVERVIATETQTVNPIHSDLYSQLISAQVQLVALNAREDATYEMQEQLSLEYDHIPDKELALVRLIRDVEMYEEIYLLLRTNYEELRINEQMHSGNLQIVDGAIVPENPIKPRVKLNIAIGGVLGLFVGVGLSFLLEFLDNTIKTKDEVEKLLSLPVIGQIPDFENKTLRSRRQKARHNRSLRM